jgi:hypothetical protein
MSNQALGSASNIDIQTLSTLRHPLFASVAAPNTNEGIGIQSSVLIFGLAIEGDTFWPQLIAKMERELCHLPIILYHGQYWEHWEWRLNRLDEVDVVLPIWNRDPSNLLVKTMAKTYLATNSMVILHFPGGESDVEKDRNCVSVSTDQ